MGFWELLLLLLLVLLFFGAGRLPGLGAALGKAVRGFRGAVARDEPAPPPRPPPPPGELPPRSPDA